ncbi:hypothetical protein HB4184_09310 [Pseudomonas putida]|nr:hypothetical protein HB4184_09310 [Pseudomonas putida]
MLGCTRYRSQQRSGAAQRFGIVALVGKQPAFTRAATLARWNADFAQQRWRVADVTGLTSERRRPNGVPLASQIM